MKRTVDWFITKRCYSKKCIFCYAPYDAFPQDASLEEALRICDELKKKEIEYVTLCGGEPLVYPYIEEVIDRLYDYGIKIILNTGLVANFDILKIVHKLHILSIPIEGVTENTYSILRGESVFKSVKKILDYYDKREKEGLKIKIGTVVNKINLNEISNIYNFLRKHKDVVDIWRLYMFSPYGIGEMNRDKLLINTAEYNAVVNEILKSAERDNVSFDISTRSRDDNKGYCFIMDSVGNFYRYEEEYCSLNVDVFDAYDEIVSKYDVGLNTEQKKWQFV